MGFGPLSGLPALVSSLLDRLPSSLTTALSTNVDSPISDCAQATDGYSATLASKINTNLNATVTSRAATPSIQSGVVDETIGPRYKDISISEVTAVENCEVRVDGSASTGSTVHGIYGTLTSTTNLRVNAHSSGLYFNCAWQVIDWGG
jgi:hypothetical protein